MCLSPERLAQRSVQAQSVCLKGAIVKRAGQALSEAVPRPGSICCVSESKSWKPIISLWYIAPMNRDEAISLLKEHEAELKRLGVERLYLFGSTARGEAKESSDIDLFFDYEKGTFGLFELMDVKEYAASILGRPTDIMTRDSLHKTLRRQIEATAVRVF